MTDQEKMIEAAKQSMQNNAALYAKLAEIEEQEKTEEPSE